MDGDGCRQVGHARSLHRGERSFHAVRGGGAVYITGDAFYYAYVPLRGDGEITARAVSMKNTVTNTTMGLMARESVEFDAKGAYFLARRTARTLSLTRHA